MNLMACLIHGMAGQAPWSCWICEALTRNDCVLGCSAKDDVYLCRRSPPAGDCSCLCHFITVAD
jgi:hypothetical protein